MFNDDNDGGLVQTPEPQPVVRWRRRRVATDPIFVLVGAAQILGFLLTFGLAVLAVDLGSQLVMDLADWLLSMAVLDHGLFVGEVWRPVTYMFVHGGIDHLFSNIVLYCIFGMVTSRALTGRNWLVVFLLGGIVGGVGEVLAAHPGTIILGSSGGVMALWGATIACALRYRATPRDERPRYAAVWLWVPLFFLVNQLVSEFGVPGVGHIAHVGGLVTGFVLGLGLPRRVVRDKVLVHLPPHRVL